MRPNHIILGVMLSLTGANAFAQSADQAVLQSQLAELKKMVEIQNKKIAELETAITQKNSGVSPEAQANLNALNAKVSSMDRKLDQSGKFSVKEGKIVEKITFSGRIQPQFDWLENETTNTNGTKTRRTDNERFFLRRLYLGADVDMGNGFSGTLNFNIANNPSAQGVATGAPAGTTVNTFDADIEKAIVTYKFKAFEEKDQAFAAGYQKVPFGIEETTSSSKIKAVERSMSNRFWAEGGSGYSIASRHTGLFLSGDLPAGFLYSLALANPDQGELDSSGANTNKPGLTARLEQKGEITSGPLAGKYLVGTDFAWQQDVLTATAGSTFIGYGVHANYTRKFFDRDFGVTAEVLTGQIENAIAAGRDASPITWMIEPTMFIDTEKKWEAVVRYSAIDTDGKGYRLSDGIRRAPSSGVNYDSLQSYYVGLNYYIKGDAVKISLGYEYGTAEDRIGAPIAPPAVTPKEDQVSGFRVRAQVLF